MMAAVLVDTVFAAHVSSDFIFHFYHFLALLHNGP